ncbi:GNAT family N-acetyltransferase [Gordonia sp. HY442]|uniref:GNAT family N-acetyltransferase n=1 Tax=Gordonia zhenghanii TaxID=2911516 RepID=UPI001F34587C|nr:GNAT family N-acetyltransferase [Gordonia zhenghanii]MCF8608318.1 GNAT family N-acetyltransferase [Gordonia zhenghanii]
MNSPTVDIVTDPGYAEDVAAVAAATFPLACPPHSSPENIAAHIDAHLSPDRFVEYIVDPAKQVLAARDDDASLIGYALIVYGTPDNVDVLAAIESTGNGTAALAAGTLAEVSKMYVLPDHHSSRNATRPSHALMQASLDAAHDHGADYAWLGVSQLNDRAQKYYRKMGFTEIGAKTFDMNGSIEQDFVMGRSV